MSQDNQIQLDRSHDCNSQYHASSWGIPMLRYLLLMAGVVAVGIGLFGCQPVVTPPAGSEIDSVTSQADAESTLVVELPILPTTLDPQQTKNQILAFATFHLYDTLLTLDQSQHFTYTASLSAAIPDTDDNGNCLFQLRTGIMFSNETVFTATHVYSSWQQRKGNQSDPWSRIDNIEILNDQTVKIIPKGDSCSEHFLNRVAPGLIVIHPQSTDQQPIGTGPYQLTKWTTDTIEMTSNSYYTREKEIHGIGRVRFQYYPSLSDALQSADIILGLTITQTKALPFSEFEPITTPVTYIHKIYGLENPKITSDVEPIYEALQKALDLQAYESSATISIDPPAAAKIRKDFMIANGAMELKLYEDTELTSSFVQSLESQLDAARLNTDVDNLPFSREFAKNEIPLLVRTFIAVDNSTDVIDPLLQDNAITTVRTQNQIITLFRNDPLNRQGGLPWTNPCYNCNRTDDPPVSTGPTYVPVGTGSSGSTLAPTTVSTSQWCYWLYVGVGESIWVCE